MKFKYKKFGPETIRPVVPVEIRYRGNSVSYEVLVDSGADLCIFDAQIGEILGIKISEGRRSDVGGITGELETQYIHPISIIVGGCNYGIEVGFLPNIAQLGYGVVGQRGFFDLFIVKFDFQKEEIEIKLRNPK